jgi:cobalt-zinc-cadmium efflux system outer membrane protein
VPRFELSINQRRRSLAKCGRRLRCAFLGALVALSCSATKAQEIIMLPRPQRIDQQPKPEQPNVEQHSGEQPRPLRLSDLENLALQYNPTMAQATAAIAMQRGTWQQAGLYPNPQVGYLRSDASNPTQPQTNGVFVAQEFVTGHKRQLARAVEAQEIERLRWEWQAQRMRVLNDLQIRYYEVLGAQEQLAIAEHLLKLAEEGVQAVERQLKTQLASRPDALQARIQLSNLRMVRKDAQARYEAAWLQLATIVGIANMAPVGLEGRLDAPVPDFTLEDTLNELLTGSPQLRAAQVEVQHAQREIARERAQPIPNITLQTVVERDRVAQSTSASTLVALPVPLFNRNQGNISRAYAELREAESEVARVRLVLRDQLADSLRRFATARYRVDEYREHVLPNAQENLELVQRGTKEGQFNLFQLLTARQTYAHANLGYVEALTELQKATVEIRGLQLTGGLNPATLGTAIQTGGGVGRQGLLNQVQEGASKQALPGAIQSLGP